MKIVKATKRHYTCKRCFEFIFIGSWYYPQRNHKALCVECGRKNTFKDKLKSSIDKFYNWIAKHGE